MRSSFVFLFAVLGVLTTGCGGQPASTERPLAEGHWTGVLPRTSNLCGFGREQVPVRIDVAGTAENVQVHMVAPESIFSSSTQPWMTDLVGTQAEDGGFTATFGTCFRCPQGTLVYGAPTVRNDGSVVAAPVTFTYLPLNGPGGCTMTWEGELTRSASSP
ncbi:MAG TPA: hypothetical protein VK447_09320 [Myxococcaceae bacterium]|nr:hypothetical protein [Myxococcaceae bacterium]